MAATLRRIAAHDRAAWDTLWDGYCAFYRSPLETRISDLTFARLCDGAGMLGFVAEDDGALVGFAHILFHASTWSEHGYCYLEDMYVAPERRGSGIARALIERVYAEADARGAERVYWHTQEYNAPARSLYDTLARRTSFVVYRR